MQQDKARIIVSFDSIADAFAFKEAAKAADIEGRLRTIPRQISAGCGTAWDSPASYRDAIAALIAANTLAYDALHALQ